MRLINELRHDNEPGELFFSKVICLPTENTDSRIPTGLDTPFCIRVKTPARLSEHQLALTHSLYSSHAIAVKACKNLINHELMRLLRLATPPEELFSKYNEEAELPYILPTPIHEPFNAKSYLRERCEELKQSIITVSFQPDFSKKYGKALCAYWYQGCVYVKYTPSEGRRVWNLIRYDKGQWRRENDKHFIESVIFDGRAFPLKSSVMNKQDLLVTIYLNTGLESIL